jgi:hypothetical protein
LRLALGAVALAASISCARDATPPAELAIAWNKQILTIAEAEDGFLTLKGVRAAAMMHLAMHDALNAIEPRHHRYTSGPPAEDAHSIVAAAQAAHEVAVDQYPDHAAALAELRDRWTTAVPDGDARRRALELGTSTARAILDRRADDGWDATSAYTWHPMGPGVYAAFHEHSGTPEGFVFGAGWSVARPFALPAPDHFRAPPPPAIHDDAYTKAFQEVKEVGAAHSQTRTPDQTHLAMWWKEFVESSHNRLARDLATRESLSLSDTVRLLALLNLAIYDAYVCVFDNKFAYNHWRPYTAIREAAHDGNPDTTPDPDWTNLHDHTYAFPSYPSAHGCASAAAMTILADTFGDETAFTMRIPEVDRAGPMSGKVPMDPPTRSFTRFSEASLECAMSRVYLGIHFRYDSVAGVELGSRIGRHVVEGFLTRVGP